MEDLDGFIIEHVTLRAAILKKIDPDELYISANLCADFWRDFIGLHTVIGKRIKKLSDNGKLPIEPAGHTSSNQRLYRLI